MVRGLFRGSSLAPESTAVSPSSLDSSLCFLQPGILHDALCLEGEMVASAYLRLLIGWFQTGKEVRQGCILSPCLFNFYAEFSSVAQSCPTVCDPMDCSTPCLPVHHQFPESTQIHVLRVSDAIQPSHPQSSPSPLAFNLSQHQNLFK